MNVHPDTGQPVAQGHWFSRNWKWIVGLGCLLPMLCCGGSVAVVAFGVMKVVKESSIYADAQERLKNSPQAAEALGAPVALEGFPMGSINTKNGRTEADLTLRARGSKQKATLFVIAEQEGEKIVYHRLDLLTDQGERVDLREQDAAEPDPALLDPSEPAPRDPPMPDQPEDEG